MLARWGLGIDGGRQINGKGWIIDVVSLGCWWGWISDCSDCTCHSDND